MNQYQSTILRLCSLSLLSAMILLPFWGFFSTWLGTSIGPLLVWKALLDGVVMAASLMVLFVAVTLTRERDVFRHTPIVMAVSFSIFSLALTIILEPDITRGDVAGILFGLRYVLIFVALYIVGYTNILGLSWREIARKVVGVVTLFLVVFGILQVTVLPASFLERFGYNKETTITPMLVIDENPDHKRAFATTRGPNDYAALLIIPLGLAVARVFSGRQNTALIIMSSIGIFLSGSRSAWLGAIAVAVTKIILYVLQHRRIRKQYVLWSTAAILVSAGIIVAATTVPALRLIVFHSSPEDTHLTEGSTDDHHEAIVNGVDRVVDDPLGCGLGCSGPASRYGEEVRISENYYLQVAEEVGIMGAVIWMSLVGSIMYLLYIARRDPWALGLLLSGFGLTVVAMLLHVWADAAVSCIWWGFAGLVLGEKFTHQSRRPVQNKVL